MKEIFLSGWRKDAGGFNFNPDVDESEKFYYGSMLLRNPFKHLFKDLIELGNAMHGNSQPNPELPAGYVFLGQFIDHDLSQDVEGGTFPPQRIIAPSKLINGRTPFLNLDVLYGEGPQVNPELYESGLCRLKLGQTEISTIDGINRQYPNDLPRKPGSPEAILVDRRNDENLGVAQTHVAFIKFHNAVVRKLSGDNADYKHFEEARKIVTRHYQWIILNDFLPKIIQKGVLKNVLDNGCKFYAANSGNPFMPVEFSVGAFRLGHSMVPRAYEWNRIFRSDFSANNKILDLFLNTGRGNLDGTPNKVLTGRWIIDWTRFYDFTKIGFPDRPKSTFALKIDTLMPYEFKRLPMGNNPLPPEEEYKLSLAIRNLFRGRRVGLPSGQDVAALFGENPIDPQIIVEKLPPNLKTKFAKRTPLWYYILTEAEVAEKGARLGPVGSRILAEVFVKLIELTPNSILSAEFKENKWQSELMPDSRRDEFEMVDILNFVREQNPDDFDELNPID